MKIFISWSGERSRAVAELLQGWIKCVLQASSPWISTRDIERGSLWFSSINDQLKDTPAGIICLTQENKNSPWILFEAGALAKGLSSNRVCTFLIDLEPTDIKDPLAQFNHTMPTKEDVRSLVETLNGQMGEKLLDDKTLNDVFETYWSKFVESFDEILRQSAPASATTSQRTERDLLEEILLNTRSLEQHFASVKRGSPCQTSVSQSITKERHDLDLFVAAQYDEILFRAIDLANEGLTKLDVVKSLRSQGFPGKIIFECIAHPAFSKIYDRERN